MATKQDNYNNTDIEPIDLSNVVIEDIEGIDTRDYPDFVDAHITAAYWKDTGEELTEEELDLVNDNTDFVYEAVIRRIF